jgi:hypothetical protein
MPHIFPRIPIIIMVLAMMSVGVAQQGVPKHEFDVGFSYLTDFDMGGSGFTVGYAERATPWFQVVVEFDANFNLAGTTFDNYSTLAGPRFSLPGKRIIPFVQMMVGASHFRAFGRTGSEFSMKYGGGIDVKLKHNLLARVELGDLVIWNPATHYLQLNTGMVFRF